MPSPDSAHCQCRGKIKHKMDHLVCFLPALLALGVQQGAVQGPKGQQYLSLAEDLTYTCWKMYSLQPTGGGSAWGGRGLPGGSAQTVLVRAVEQTCSYASGR